MVSGISLENPASLSAYLTIIPEGPARGDDSRSGLTSDIRMQGLLERRTTTTAIETNGALRLLMRRCCRGSAVKSKYRHRSGLWKGCLERADQQLDKKMYDIPRIRMKLGLKFELMWREYPKGIVTARLHVRPVPCGTCWRRGSMDRSMITNPLSLAGKKRVKFMDYLWGNNITRN